MPRAMEPMVYTRKGEQYALRDSLGNTVVCAAKRYRFNLPVYIVIGGRLPNSHEPEGVVFVKELRHCGQTTDCIVAKPAAYGLQWKELNHVTT